MEGSMDDNNVDNNIPHPLFRLMMQSVMMIPEQDNNVEQRSFNEQKTKIKPCTSNFIESLEDMIINEDDIKNNLSCAICQESFKLNEIIKELPCKPKSHYFHFKNENCDGIIPWLMLNNTCPICRFEFPSQESSQESSESQESSIEQNNITNNEINMESNNIIQYILRMRNYDSMRDGFSDGDTDEAIRRSLE